MEPVSTAAVESVDQASAYLVLVLKTVVITSDVLLVVIVSEMILVASIVSVTNFVTVGAAAADSGSLVACLR